jgi:pyruvate,water dikinase
MLGRSLAVRSSSVEEDGASASFAGQFDSFLDVSPGDIVEYVLKVVRSGTSAHLDTYREATGNENPTRAPSVLVQTMIHADAAGVAFAVDPVDGSRECAVVAAVKGTGDRLVSGEVQGDTWRIDRDGRIVSRDIDGTRAVIRDRIVRSVAKLVRKVSEERGCPQDIEWAIEKGRLYLLQSRDITAAPGSTDAFALWDNSNIVESYGGVTTPLTFSVARHAYSEAYRHMGRVIGVSEREIAANHDAYEQMIGLIRGRVYYNLLNWYRLLMLAPGFRFNGRFMEQMMGVTDGLPPSALPNAGRPGPLAGMRATMGMVRVGWRLLRRLVGHDKAVSQFHDRVDQALAPVDLARLSVSELIDYYDALQAEVIPAWDTPLVNDLFCMVFHGALRQLCERWLDASLKDVHNDLVAGGDDIISLVPVKEMAGLARIAARDESFVEVLCHGDMDEVMKRVAGNEAFSVPFERYLDRFGDRCLDELKLESETLRDDPTHFLRGIGLMAKQGPGRATNGGARAAVEFDTAQVFERRGLTKRVFEFVLEMARARVRDRENMRFERTRVYGRVRAVFVEIGTRLREAGVLEQVSDIFYLDVAEAAGFIRGTGISSDIGAIARHRKMEFQAFEKEADPPRRFVTKGPPQLRSSIQETSQRTECRDSNSRSGQACSQGIIRGPVRIVRDPREAQVRDGEILVAQRTDPGWVTIFPLVSGMIMERGSLLSHSAIVARELGIPAVVGVEDACNWLRDGDWVELDGGTGSIRRIARHDVAA